MTFRPEDDSLFQFLAEPASSGTYTFQVKQTYSDGSIVNWSGSESSEAPAPTIEAKSSLGGGGTPVATIIAIVLGALGVILGGGRAVHPRWREAGPRVTQRGRGVVVATLVALALILPGVASAHAYLVRTVPTPSANLNAPPPAVALTFDEAVEPRFAIISVTNAAGRQETTAPVSRSPANPDTLVVPLRPHLPEGWYLVYWRAISVDGHPVQGAYTFAIGPNAGPQP